MWRERNKNIDLNYIYAVEAKFRTSARNERQFRLHKEKNDYENQEFCLIGWFQIKSFWQLADWNCVRTCVIDLWMFLRHLWLRMKMFSGFFCRNYKKLLNFLKNLKILLIYYKISEKKYSKSSTKLITNLTRFLVSFISYTLNSITKSFQS